MLHNAHVAEYYYARALHAEGHYFNGSNRHFQQLYLQLALASTMMASKEQKSLWLCGK